MPKKRTSRSSVASAGRKNEPSKHEISDKPQDLPIQELAPSTLAEDNSSVSRGGSDRSRREIDQPHVCIGGQGSANIFPGATVAGDITVKKEYEALLKVSFGNVNIAQIGDGNTVLCQHDTTGDSSVALSKQRHQSQTKSYADAIRSQASSPDSPDSSETQKIPVSAPTVNITMNLTTPTQAKHVDVPADKRVDFCLLIEKVKEFKGDSYILIAGETKSKPYQSALALVPWSFIFSFDIQGRSSGLLSVLGPGLTRRKRSLYKNSWQDKCTVTEQSTHWVDLFGSSQTPESLTPVKFMKWWKHVKKNLESQIQQLAQFTNVYTTMTVVVLWPEKQEIERHIQTLLTLLDESTDVNIVILNQSSCGETGPMANLKEDMGEDKLTIVHLTTEDLCKAIAKCLPNLGQSAGKPFNLPKMPDKTTDQEITDHDASRLSEDLEVLYAEYPIEKDITQEMLMNECDNFYKGGTLPWYIWYRIGAGHVDVERDIMREILQSIQHEYIEAYQGGCIELCHAPGSGGTTLGKRILWELRHTLPCAQAKLHTGSTVQELTQRVELLYEKTGMQVLLLMDGEDQLRVDTLMKNLENKTIIIYVKRYPYRKDEEPINKKGYKNEEFYNKKVYGQGKESGRKKGNEKGKESSKMEGEKREEDSSKTKTYFLPGVVTKHEAQRFALKFEKQCDDRKTREAVIKLSDDVAQGKTRYVYEFGLTAYKYEYRGIESYVRGCLRLDENEKDTPRKQWQEALGYLSLVYYYGQSSVPCRFFSKMLQMKAESSPVASFPAEMQELIVSDESDRKQTIRICHYYIAQEVLEQLLPWPQNRRLDRSQYLSKQTKNKLEPFSVGLIQMAGEHVKDSPSNAIVSIMTRTFISRDNKMVGEEETTVKPAKRKPKLSPILEDLDQGHPYTERFRVLKSLTMSFPKEAHYFAHLGRLYTICRPEDESNAVKCFKNALCLCEEAILGKDIEEYSFNTRLTLMHVYHMTGVMYSQQVAKYTGRSLTDRQTIQLEDQNKTATAKELLTKVRKACYYFEKCRDVNPPGQKKSYYYIDDINVRLQLCDFIHRYCCSDYGISEFMSDPESDDELASFVEESFSQIDYLFLECFSVIEPEHMDQSVKSCETWFTSLFRSTLPGHVVLKSDGSIQSRRIQIAARKLQYSKSKYRVLEHISSADDIHFIVQELENIFKAVHEKNEPFNRRELDLDYREWLVAIRHTLLRQTYSIESVYRMTQRWFEQLNTPHSRFYLFIMKSLLGFGWTNRPGDTKLLIEAQQVKEDLLKQAKLVTKPRYPREYLGIEEGIKLLVSNDRFFRQIEGRDILSQHLGSFAIVKGTIRKPNDKPAAGYIDLDLGELNRVPVEVFFVPVRCRPDILKGSSYAGLRVEFVIGFSLSHGYEAFNVRLLKIVVCQTCQLPREVTSREKTIVCSECGSEMKTRIPKCGDN